jgi:hypothetical protein
MTELEILNDLLLKQQKYIKELKDIIEIYESLVQEHLIRKPAEMSENEELWKQYIGGELE